MSIFSSRALGGVLEKNEIFNNRFDGVSLATGVLPKMLGQFILKKSLSRFASAFPIEVNLKWPSTVLRKKFHIYPSILVSIHWLCFFSLRLMSFLHFFIDNYVYDNKKVLAEAINTGKCLYQVSGSLCYPMHDFYRYVFEKLLRWITLQWIY